MGSGAAWDTCLPILPAPNVYAERQQAMDDSNTWVPAASVGSLG